MPAVLEKSSDDAARLIEYRRAVADRHPRNIGMVRRSVPFDGVDRAGSKFNYNLLGSVEIVNMLVRRPWRHASLP